MSLVACIRRSRKRKLKTKKWIGGPRDSNSRETNYHEVRLTDSEDDEDELQMDELSKFIRANDNEKSRVKKSLAKLRAECPWKITIFMSNVYCRIIRRLHLWNGVSDLKKSEAYLKLFKLQRMIKELELAEINQKCKDKGYISPEDRQMCMMISGRINKLNQAIQASRRGINDLEEYVDDQFVDEMIGHNIEIADHILQNKRLDPEKADNMIDKMDDIDDNRLDFNAAMMRVSERDSEIYMTQTTAYTAPEGETVDSFFSGIYQNIGHVVPDNSVNNPLPLISTIPMTDGIKESSSDLRSGMTSQTPISSPAIPPPNKSTSKKNKEGNTTKALLVKSEKNK